MSRIYCETCKEFFDSEELNIVTRTSDSGYMHDEWYCPFCCSDELIEIHNCACGNEIIDEDEQLCTECKKKVQNLVNELFQKLTVAEQEFAAECMCEV